MIPEQLLVNELLNVFTVEQIAPASDAVYHEQGPMPSEPMALYRRVSTEYERDLASLPHAQVVTFEVTVQSIFFSQLDVSMPDNWIDDSTGSTWYFALEGQDQDTSNYLLTFTYSAATAL